MPIDPRAAASRPTLRTTLGRAAAIACVFGGLGAGAWLDRAAPSAPVGADDTPVVLVERSATSGLLFEHRISPLDPLIDHVRDRILSVGAGVSAVDVDRDGWIDLYCTNSAFGAANALFVNRGDGTFEDRAATVGLADLNVVGDGLCMGSIWADYDGDGDEDAFVYRYGRTALMRQDASGRFEDVASAAGVERWLNSNAACWIDFDRDGWLDLLVTSYFREEHDLWNLTTSNVMHDSAEFSSNGGRNVLFRNRGDGTFEDVTEAALPDTRRWTMAAGAADFDEDGWIDLYLANDYGPEELWLNRPTADGAGRRFELAEAGLGHDSKSGMCVALGNLRNDGRLAIFVSNISAANYLFHGNSLRVNRMADAGRVLEGQAGRAVTDTGWSWGAAFGDLDNDGWQDLWVTNGFVSADPERDYWYRMSQLSGGTGGLLADAANWPAFDGASQSGFERSRVLHNNGGRRLVEIGAAAGVHEAHDGRAVILVDLENRGVLDAVVANQRGPLEYFRNETPGAAERGWIQFELRGRAPNTSAIGAAVSVTFGGGTQLQVVEGSSGFSAQSARRLHFGLGDEVPGAGGESIVTVHWPDGTRETFTNLEPRRLHRIEQGPGRPDSTDDSNAR
ncbi:ASPIC and UnbV [Planctomycetes bacterium Pla163]|uniref:ASPIC and UnbV n=1 Tax=Rohdeia mirabilis TaxID=2528008 RepID=A0A518D486_9BACT|nr:ASPIC and UnbV [Planctomycetes bacterium Pla163]